MWLLSPAKATAASAADSASDEPADAVQRFCSQLPTLQLPRDRRQCLNALRNAATRAIDVREVDVSASPSSSFPSAYSSGSGGSLLPLHGPRGPFESFDFSALSPFLSVPVSIPAGRIAAATAVQRALAPVIPLLLHLIRQNTQQLHQGRIGNGNGNNGGGGDAAVVIECLLLLQCATATLPLSPSGVSDLEAADTGGEVISELDAHWRQAAINANMLLRADMQATWSSEAQKPEENNTSRATQKPLHGVETLLRLVDVGVASIVQPLTEPQAASDPSVCFNAIVVLRCIFAASTRAACQCLLAETDNGIVRICDDLRVCAESGVFRTQMADPANARHPCVRIGMQIVRLIAASAGTDAELAQIAAFSDIFPTLLAVARDATTSTSKGATGSSSQTPAATLTGLALAREQDAVSDTAWTQATACLSCMNLILAVQPKQAVPGGIAGQIRQFRESGCVRLLLPLLDIGLGWSATATASRPQSVPPTASPTSYNSTGLDESYTRGLLLTDAHTRCLAAGLLCLEILCQGRAPMSLDREQSPARNPSKIDAVGDFLVSQGTYDVLLPLALRRVAPKAGAPVRALALRVLGSILLAGTSAIPDSSTFATNDRAHVASIQRPRNFGAKDVFARVTVPVTIEHASAGSSSQSVHLAAVSRLVMVALQQRLDVKEIGKRSGQLPLLDTEQQKLVALLREQQMLQQQEQVQQYEEGVGGGFMASSRAVLHPTDVYNAGITMAERNNALRAFAAWLWGCDEECTAMATTVTPMPKSAVGMSMEVPVDIAIVERFGLGAIGRLLCAATVDADPTLVGSDQGFAGVTSLPMPVHLGVLLQGVVQVPGATAAVHGRDRDRVATLLAQGCVPVAETAIKMFLASDLLLSILLPSYSAAKVLLKTPLEVPEPQSFGQASTVSRALPLTLATKAMASLCLSLRVSGTGFAPELGLGRRTPESANRSVGLFLSRVALFKVLIGLVGTAPVEAAAALLGRSPGTYGSEEKMKTSLPLLIEAATQTLASDAGLLSQQQQLQQVHIQGLSALLLLLLWSATSTEMRLSPLESTLRSRIGFDLLSSKLSQLLRSSAFQAAEQHSTPLDVGNDISMLGSPFAGGDAVAGSQSVAHVGSSIAYLGGRSGGSEQWFRSAPRAARVRWTAIGDECARIPMLYLYSPQFAMTVRRASDAVLLRLRGGNNAIVHGPAPPTPKPAAQPPIADTAHVADSYKGLIAAQESENAALRKRNAELEQTLSSLHDDAMTAALNDSAQQIADLKRQLDKARLELEEQSSAAEHAQAEVRSLSSSISSLEQQRTSSQEEIVRLRQRAETLERDQHQDDKATASVDVDDKSAEQQKQLEEELNSRQRLLDNATHAQQQLERELSRIRDEARGAKLAQESAVRQVERLQESAKQQDSAYSRLQEEQDELLLALATLEMENTSLKARLSVYAAPQQENGH